jgi:hypothetical protein
MKISQIERFEDMPTRLWPSKSNSAVPLSPLILFTCDDCGHFQLQNLEDEFISSLYDGDYMNLDSSGMNEVRATYLKGKNQLETSTILDVGGGTNSSHKFFRSANYSILDPQDPADARVNHIKGLISTSSLSKDFYGYIFAFHIFEHLENPRRDLQILSECLKEGGRIFVEIPESKYYAKFIPYYLFFHQHINLFTMETLDKLFSLEGFHKIDMLQEGGRLLITYEKSQYNFLKIQDQTTTKTNPIIGVDKQFFETKEKEIISDLESLGSGEIVFLGAGGSTTLLLYHFPNLSKRVDSFMDNDIRKIGLNFPGTTKVIKQMSLNPEMGKIYLTLGEAIFVNWRNRKPDRFVDVKSYFHREVK